MQPETKKEYLARYLKVVKKLLPYDFVPMGIFKFEKGGKIHDLSATDLNWAIRNL